MQHGIVYTDIPLTDPDLVVEAARYAVSDLHEGLGAVIGRMALMSPRMRPIRTGQRIAGQAVTASNYPGDNLLVHKALHLATAGQVLVLVNGGGNDGALWGEIAAIAAKTKAVAGVIADGPVRDVDALSEMLFPVWSTSISASHPEKRGPGSVNVPVICDGALVNPGDFVVADGDGVLVIPRERLRSAVEGAGERCAREATLRERIAAGESLFDLLDIDRHLDSAGIERRKGTWIKR